MAEGKTLITPVYKKEYLSRAIGVLEGIDKLVLIAAEDGSKKEVEDAIEETRAYFEGTMEVDVLRAGQYEMPKIARMVSDKIREEHPREIIVNITHGRRSQAWAAAYAAFANDDKVSEIVYLPVEGGKMVLPKLKLSMSEKKQQILKLVSEGGFDVEDAADELDISPGMVYNHLRDLREQGYVRKEGGGYQIAGAGEMMASLV